MTKAKIKNIWNLIWKNALRFIFNVGYSFIFPMIFGMENVLPSVALCVGLTMLPYSDLNIKPHVMATIIIGLNLGCGLVSQLAFASPWIALPVNLLFCALLLILTCEPTLTKPSISFLLCFIFCQANPVPVEKLPMRMLSLLAGSVITAVTMIFVWRHKEFGKDGRTFIEQIKHCAVHYSYILRMSIGLSAAMFIGSYFHLMKPLWISVVVMSLTQMNVNETIERIKLRTVGTVIGAVVFVVIFGFIIPEKYSVIAVLVMGYLSFFTSDYKHKTIVNAVSAINASLVLMDTSRAINNRVICLASGIGIVLVMWAIQHIAGFIIKNVNSEQKICRKNKNVPNTTDAILKTS